MIEVMYIRQLLTVAPVRERGLKLLRSALTLSMIISRSREGAWIEIQLAAQSAEATARRSREGAWIEINLTNGYYAGTSVAPVRERGLKW